MQILPALDHSGGGVERGTLDIAKYISEIGYNSVIVSSGGTMAEKFKHKGVLHYKLPIQKKSLYSCLLYTSPSPRDGLLSRMPSSA